MILKGLFGHRTTQTTETPIKSNIINFVEKADLKIQKQLANCMKDIQQLMLRKKVELKPKMKIKVTLQPV